MAARRLLIVMLLLLVLSTLAGVALGPPERAREETGTTETEETTTPTDTVPRGELLEATIVVRAEKLPVIPVEVGDQLSLLVRSKRADQVAIPRLGLIEAVDPFSPARFDILAEEPGSYRIRLVEADRVVARIEVSEAIAADSEGPTSPAREGRAEASAPDRP
jgi:hypothetical protein